MERRGSGWIVFSSIILIFAGLMRIIDGLWALQYKGKLPDQLQDTLLGEKLKNYGWLWILVGIVLLLAGIAVQQRSQLGRWVGIIGAAIGGLSAMLWMPYYPIWSLTYVAIAIAVIYGLTVYGAAEVADA